MDSRIGGILPPRKLRQDASDTEGNREVVSGRLLSIGLLGFIARHKLRRSRVISSDREAID